MKSNPGAPSSLAQVPLANVNVPRSIMAANDPPLNVVPAHFLAGNSNITAVPNTVIRLNLGAAIKELLGVCSLLTSTDALIATLTNQIDVLLGVSDRISSSSFA